jgi:hypothetical protein
MRGGGLVYGAVGNHEANPVNSFPPQGVRTLANYSNQYIYDTLAGNWFGCIGPGAAATVALRAPELIRLSIQRATSESYHLTPSFI